MYTGSGIYAPNEGPVDVGRILDIIHTPQGDGALVMLDHQTGKDGALRRIREGAPNAVIMIRRYTPNWLAQTPAECAYDFIDMMHHMQPHTAHGTWANEQNLAVESAGALGAADGRLITWDEWRRIADYNQQVASLVRDTAPWIILHYPAVAYGHGEDWPYDEHHNLLPGFTPTSLAYDLLRPGIDLCHILNVHPYVKPGYAIMDPWNGLGRLARVKALFPDKTLFADETGDFQVFDQHAADHILNIAYALQAESALLGYSFFILDSTDPAHDSNNWSKNRSIEDAYSRMTRTTRPVAWSEPAPSSPPVQVEPPSFLPGPVGRAWWVWYADHCGGAQGIIQHCRDTNVSAVFIKGGDGPYAWDQLTPELVNTLADAGIDVYAWHYAYLGWLPGTVHGDSWKWTFADEIACVETMLARSPRLKGFIVDAEAETEGRPEQATAYASSVRSALGERFFAYAPLPVIDYHTSLPYVQFNAICDAAMPQFYSKNLQGFPAWTYTRLVEQWSRWQNSWTAAGLRTPPITPVGEAYGEADAESIETFEQLAHSEPWTSWSYWSLEHAIQTGLISVIADIAQQEHSTMITLNAEDKAAVEAMLAQVWGNAERINAILSNAEYGDPGRRIGYWQEYGMKGVLDLLKANLGM